MLPEEELREWMNSPEQFLVDHQPGSNQTSLLPCSQSLFKKLLPNFPLVVPSVISYIQSLLGNLPQDLNGVLLKGLKAFALPLTPRRLVLQRVGPDT